MSKIKIIITGSSGFIGTNLMNHFIDKEYEVLGIDIKKPKINSHLLFFKCIDILNLKELQTEFLNFRPHIIIHLAARTDLDGASIESYNVNTIGTKNVVLATRLTPSINKAIFASSMLVNKVGYTPKNDLDCNPNNLYGESKVISESIIREFMPVHSNWIIIRPTSIWGPWFSTPYRNFFELVMLGRYASFTSASSKTFGYVGNSIFQIDRLLYAMNSSFSGEVFYLGDDPEININKWANQISIEAKRGKIVELPYGLFYLSAKFGDFLKLFNIRFLMNSYRLNNMKTNNIIDLTKTYKICGLPPYTLNEGIKNTVNWINSSK